MTRTDDVIERLRGMVLEGQFAPGTHLQEVHLAKMLGVSRTPIRDALRVLGQEDLLTYEPNRGYFVSLVEIRDILDAYDVRGMLEGMGCRICVENGLEPEMVAELEQILEASQEIFTGKREISEWGRLNSRFHLLIVEGSKNKHLLLSTRQMRRIPRIFDKRLQPSAAFFQDIYTRDRLWSSYLEHVGILDAMISGQGTRAEYLMREHVYHNRESVRQRLEKLDIEERNGAQSASSRELTNAIPKYFSPGK